MLSRRVFLAAGTTAGFVLPVLRLPTEAGPLAKPRRRLPSTRRAVGVFNDQMSESLSDAQVKFAATNYAGSQKQTRRFADRLRAINPGFVILHYRLALGAGPALFIERNRWVTDWPFVERHDGWFFPAGGGARFHQLTWDWWLMDPDGPWRQYWIDEVRAECRMNDDDGVFADSCSVPNFFGADTFDPPMQAYDPPFEAAWTRKINRYLRAIKRDFGDSLYLIPNAGSWVTTRDTTDYSAADGVMIEGFGQWGAGSYFAVADWELQMDRILGLARRGKAVIHQSYFDPDDMKSRGFLMASYLLVKGEHSYVNFELGFAPEWFPEYRLRLGTALDPLPARVASFGRRGVYRRRFENGLVLVNPGDGTVDVTLPEVMRLVTPVGGGTLPENASEAGMRLTTKAVAKVRLGDHEGVVLYR